LGHDKLTNLVDLARSNAAPTTNSSDEDTLSGFGR
jgi:hypothetical protein